MNNLMSSNLFMDNVIDYKERGNGQYIGKCPSHDDKHNSFSFNVDNGVFKCFAGCGSGDLADFAKLIGQDPKPYYKNSSEPNNPIQINHKTHQKLNDIDIAKAKEYHQYLKDNWDTISKPIAWSSKQGVKLTTTGYNLQQQRFTFVHTDKKGFIVNLRHHKDKAGNNGYSVKGHGTTTLFPLFILDDYDYDKLLIIAEGEKDVVSLQSIGIQAVTVTNGADSIPKDLTPLNKFDKIIICYDNDDAGINGSLKMAIALHGNNQNAEIKIFHWKNDLPKGYDITDYLNSKNSKDDLFNLLKTAKKYIPENIHEPDQTSLSIESSNFDINIHSLKYMINDTTKAPPQIISKGILPQNSILLLHGSPKAGKSILACNLALSLSAGINWFDFEIEKPYKTLMIQAEVYYYELRKRLKTMLRDNEYIKAENNLSLTDSKGFDILSTLGISFIHDSIKKHSPEILIIDPLKDYHLKDENSNTDMAIVMNRLREIVNAFNISIILVHHSKKNNDSYGGGNIRGASNIFGSVDSVIELKTKKDRSRKLNFELRYGSELEEMNLDLNPMSLFFESIVDNSISDNSKILIEIVKKYPKGITIEKLKKNWMCKTGMKKTLYYKTQKQLIKDSKIEIKKDKCYIKKDTIDFPN